MSVKIAQGGWVVVCDGAKALVLENVGDEKFPNLNEGGVRAGDPRTHEQGTEAPGRSFNSIDARRSAMDQTDWHDQAEHRFLENLAGHLDAAVNSGQAKSLIVVAPPRALGVLRKAYSHNLRSALHAEIDKDLVKLPVHQIEQHLAG